MMSVVPWRRQARTLASTWALRPMCALRRRHSKTRAAFAEQLTQNELILH